MSIAVTKQGAAKLLGLPMALCDDAYEALCRARDKAWQEYRFYADAALEYEQRAYEQEKNNA